MRLSFYKTGETFQSLLSNIFVYIRTTAVREHSIENEVSLIVPFKYNEACTGNSVLYLHDYGVRQ